MFQLRSKVAGLFDRRFMELYDDTYKFTGAKRETAYIKRQLGESKQDILTLVNLIPRNEGNESIINDIKNLLKL